MQTIVCGKCGRPADKRGKTCCQMCWVGYGTHSRLCRKRFLERRMYDAVAATHGGR